MSEQGYKETEGKLPWDLMPMEPINEILRVYQFGAEYYGERNWEKGISWRKAAASIFRHATEFVLGSDKDEKSGLHPLAHAAWWCIALMWYGKNRVEFDDRGITYPYKVEKSIWATYSSKIPTEDGLYPTEKNGVFSGLFKLQNGHFYRADGKGSIIWTEYNTPEIFLWGPKLD
jgi:hypothetical protein